MHTDCSDTWPAVDERLKAAEEAWVIIKEELKSPLVLKDKLVLDAFVLVVDQQVIETLCTCIGCPLREMTHEKNGLFVDVVERLQSLMTDVVNTTSELAGSDMPPFPSVVDLLLECNKRKCCNNDSTKS